MTVSLKNFRLEAAGLDRATVNWTDAHGLRCHVWVRNGAVEDTVYVNPPLTVANNDYANGYFRTRQLSLSAKKNAKAREVVLALASPENLVEVAEQARKAVRDRLRQERAEHLAKVRACVEAALPNLRDLTDEEVMRLERAVYDAKG